VRQQCKQTRLNLPPKNGWLPLKSPCSCLFELGCWKKQVTVRLARLFFLRHSSVKDRKQTFFSYLVVVVVLPEPIRRNGGTEEFHRESTVGPRPKIWPISGQKWKRSAKYGTSPRVRPSGHLLSSFQLFRPQWPNFCPISEIIATLQVYFRYWNILILMRLGFKLTTLLVLYCY